MNQDTAVKIIPYNSHAPRMFRALAQSLKKIIPYKMKIEHVGSTAVIGLGGKGIIDILLITERNHISPIIELLKAKDYTYNPQLSTLADKPFVYGRSRYLGTEFKVHIHVTFEHSTHHEDMLLFRDYMRQYPKEATHYYHLKKQWGREAGLDRLRFSELKNPYVNQVLQKARKIFKI